ncbi:hypothetical protein J6O48_06440 [bacterium]|nr:hypothetical protein [bacterium]
MLHKISRIVKNISFMLLSWQGEFLQKRLIKRLGYKPKQIVDGCTVDISQEEHNLQEKVDNEVRILLKKLENNPKKIEEFFRENNIKIYQIKRAEKKLKSLGETVGFITERTGWKALFLNMLLKNKPKLKTQTCIVLDSGELDIYILINCVHKWFAQKEGLLGFDEKSQRLLKKFNKVKNEDKLIGRLSIPEIEQLKNAIARDVQAIEFVSKYSRENAGAKNALEKMQSDKGASI